MYFFFFFFSPKTEKAPPTLPSPSFSQETFREKLKNDNKLAEAIAVDEEIAALSLKLVNAKAELAAAEKKEKKRAESAAKGVKRRKRAAEKEAAKANLAAIAASASAPAVISSDGNIP